MFPVNIVLTYAWYFEKDRYDWSFEITGNLKEYNKKFPKGHAIGPEHARDILSEPQMQRPFMYHMRCGYGQRFLSVTACHTESIPNSDQVNTVLSG